MRDRGFDAAMCRSRAYTVTGRSRTAPRRSGGHDIIGFQPSPIEFSSFAIMRAQGEDRRAHSRHCPRRAEPFRIASPDGRRGCIAPGLAGRRPRTNQRRRRVAISCAARPGRSRQSANRGFRSPGAGFGRGDTRRPVGVARAAAFVHAEGELRLGNLMMLPSIGTLAPAGAPCWRAAAGKRPSTRMCCWPAALVAASSSPQRAADRRDLRLNA